MSLRDILVTPLKRVSVPNGDVMHALKATDAGFCGFGEAYFTEVHGGAIKAWKQHQRMTLNLVVPVGSVKFVFHHPDEGFREEVLGPQRYVRLTVPPGLWFGFGGMGRDTSTALNVASIPHDPDEQLRLEMEKLPYDWRLEAH